jgi:hypothetical protein
LQTKGPPALQIREKGGIDIKIIDIKNIVKAVGCLSKMWGYINFILQNKILFYLFKIMKIN